jgi:Flp pilus assembly protein TadG
MKRLPPLTAGPTQARRDERGDAMIIWCLGLAVLLLPIGGISLDLWHVVSQERALQTAASSAANAGASGVDTTTYRASHGQTILLDPPLATSLALQNLSDQTDPPPLSQPPQVAVAPGDHQIDVQLHESVHLTLLSILVGNRPVNITATAASTPRPSP